MPRDKSQKQKRIAFRHVEHKRLVGAIYVLLRASVILTLIAQFFNRNYENAFLCVLTLVLFTLPALFERRLNIDLPDTLEVIILLFIYAAEILGEISSYYITFPYWDTMLHTLNGFLCAAIGFSLVDLLNRNERFSLNLSPFFMAVVAFCFSMTIGVLWEFFEFAMDHLLLFDMQKDTVLNTISTVMLDPDQGTKAVVRRDIADVILVYGSGAQEALGLGGYLDVGIVDTMKDLFVNFIGAVVFSFVGYFFVKSRGRGRFARRFIPRVLTDDEAAEAIRREQEAVRQSAGEKQSRKARPSGGDDA